MEGTTMSLNFLLESANTIFLLRDLQGKVVKYSRKITDSFLCMTYLGNHLYYDHETELIWNKKSRLIVCDNCQYLQEEYIDVTELWVENKKLLQQLTIDPLTKVANVKAVEDLKNRIIEEGKSCSLVMCDINNFKEINDEYGHLIGDQCLSEIAKLFNQMVGTSDLVARVGGDEFLFIFSTDNKEEVKIIMETIQQRVQELGILLKIPLSISTGISFYQKGDDWNQKREEADKASYQNKQLLKNNGSYTKKISGA